MKNFSLDSCFPYPFVGLFGCSTIPAPSTGLYVNDLEGINTIRVSQLTDLENPLIAVKFKSIYRRALTEFYQDIITNLDYDNIEFNSSAEAMTFLGELGESSDCAGISEIGYRITKNKSDHLQILNVGSISFIPAVQFNLTVEIREQGVVTKTVNLITTAGLVNNIELNYSTYANTFEVVLIINENEIFNVPCNSCITYNDNCGCLAYECPCFYAQPITKEVGLSAFVNSGANGIKICGACICDPVALICKYANQLAIPFRYKLGIAILEDALNSDNVTPLTTSSRDSIKDLLKTWVGLVDPLTGRWIYGKYNMTMKNTIKFISKMATKLHSNCIVCTGVRYQNEIY
jgi:hypothetical protein